MYVSILQEHEYKGNDIIIYYFNLDSFTIGDLFITNEIQIIILCCYKYENNLSEYNCDYVVNDIGIFNTISRSFIF